MTRRLLAAACLVLGACATVPRGPAPLDPVGTYEFRTMVGGSPVSGTIQITGATGAYAGVVRSAAMADLPVTAVEVEGQEMRVSVRTPDGTVVLHLIFEGDAFTGHWSMAGDGADISGRRLPN